MFTELASTPPKSPKPPYRLCLDSVKEANEEFPYALVWRGNKSGPDGFRHEPAHFSWKSLGTVIREAVKAGRVTPEEVGELVTELVRPDDSEDPSRLR
jgi:hypothetical protein